MAQSFYPYRDEIVCSGNFIYYASAVPTTGDFNLGDLMIVVPTAATPTLATTATSIYRCTTASSAHNGGSWTGISSGVTTVTSPLIAAATANETIWLADASYNLVAISVVVGTVTAASGTIQLEYATGTQAVGSGTGLFTAINPVTANTPANTVTAVTLTSNPTVIAAGNRINFLTSGTLTSLAGVMFVLTLTRN
jgi:hypothetical protein